MPNLYCYLAIPVFFLLFVLCYEPAFMRQLLGAGEGVSGIGNVHDFNLVMVAVILLAVSALTRNLLFILRRVLNFNLLQYALWCLMELFSMSFFVALYLVLMDSGQSNWFVWMGRSFTALFSILVYVYAIHTLLYGWHDALRAGPPDETLRMKFYDSRHILKFVTQASTILYISSNENYIVIHYQENGVEREFELRNSLKSVEGICEKAGFVRCHRCHIVNPAYITTIRKDENGFFFVELSGASTYGVPVSKKYYDGVAAML